MHDPEFSGRFVVHLTAQISQWFDAGKLSEEDLDRVLTPDAQAVIDASLDTIDWVPLADVESFIEVLAEQLGHGAGLVEWAGTVAEEWASDADIVAILAKGDLLIDGTGFAVAELSDLLMRKSRWQFRGSREYFSVSLPGLEDATSDLKALLGALISRLAESRNGRFDDLRFDGIDSGDFRIFGECSVSTPTDASVESRLHRAALIG